MLLDFFLLKFPPGSGYASEAGIWRVTLYSCTSHQGAHSFKLTIPDTAHTAHLICISSCVFHLSVHPVICPCKIYPASIFSPFLPSFLPSSIRLSTSPFIHLSVADQLFRIGREGKWGKKRKKQEPKECCWVLSSMWGGRRRVPESLVLA